MHPEKPFLYNKNEYLLTISSYKSGVIVYGFQERYNGCVYYGKLLLKKGEKQKICFEGFVGQNYCIFSNEKHVC